MSDNDESIVNKLQELWATTIQERLAVTTPDGISFMEQDTVTHIMETLADISNACMLHFFKLAFYQSQLENDLVPVDQSFTNKMPQL